MNNHWIFYAILAQVFFTVSLFIDKYLVSSRFKDWRAIPIYTGLTNGFLGLVLWVVLGFPVPPVTQIAIILLTGISTIIGLTLYYAAISTDQASNVVIFMKMQPILVLLWSSIFLRESLSGNQLVGFILILFSGIAVAFEGHLRKLRLSKGFSLMFLANFFLSLPEVLFKGALQEGSFWQMINFESWGFFVGGIILFIFVPSMRRAFVEHFHGLKITTAGLLIVNEADYLLGRIIFYFALISGPVALVSVLGASQVVVVLIMGWVLGMTVPSIFKEEAKSSLIFKKVVFAILLILGIVLIYR